MRCPERVSVFSAPVNQKRFYNCHELPVFVRHILILGNQISKHALQSRKSSAAAQGQGSGFLLGFFYIGFAGDGWMALLAQFDCLESRAVVLRLTKRSWVT